MRKMIFTLVLAIVSSVWMTNEAGNWCMPSVRTLTEPWIEVNGTFQAEGFPCEPDEICPPCLTIVLVTSNKTYYLVTDDGQLIDQLDTIQLGTKATVSGIPFEQGSYDYIQVSHIETDRTSQLPSLCDEWNVLHEPFSCDGIYCRLQTLIYRLTTDTLIQDVNYVKLMEQEGSNTYYKGAMREGTNRDIYYVPANSTHEYLLYAFNAQEGDQLNNVWLGGETEKEDCTNAHNATIIAISDSNPRIFTLEIIPFTSYEGMEVYPYWMEWIEGVGMSDGPVGAYDSNKLCPSAADLGVFTLLCAYKNGEQVYSSSKSERYGCEFNGIPSTKPYSLCDTWNVMEVGLVTSPDEVYHTVTQRLTKDTIIAYPSYYNFTPYARLEENGKYKGAMREEGYGKIYYIPAGSTHEYLLYNFNAKVGDRLTNLWFGGPAKEYPKGLNATITEISNTSPRVFTLAAELVHAESDAIDTVLVFWTEGVGMETGPVGMDCFYCACSCGQTVLCAYKNGEQVYVSDMGEQYGCVYNYDPYAPSDTIPLFSYTGDDPGSSTVDPVDPNQVVATLKNDELTIKEFSGETISYQLTNIQSNNVPASRRTPQTQTPAQTQTFKNEVSLTLTEEGRYTLILTNPNWDYSIYGTFNYPRAKDGIDNTPSSSDTRGKAHKILIDGQLLIEKNNKTYNVLGTPVK